MKVKIKSFADGGGFSTFTPIIRNAPNTGATSGEQSTKKEKEESEDSIIDENMVKFLYSEKGGLVNDVNQLVSELIQIERSNPMAFLDGNNRELALRIAAKMNEVASNKEYWKEAIQNSQKTGGYDEIAIDPNGGLFIKTSGGISQIGINNYMKNPEKYNPLTVQELMYERQYNPKLTNKNEVFSVANNSIGLDKISDYIKGIVSAIGQESYSEDSFYSKVQAQEYLAKMSGKKPTKNDLKALEILNKVLSGPEAFTKITSTIESERNHIDKALQYIWTTLPKNAQHKLAVAAAMNGKKSPTEYIMEILEFGTNYKSDESSTPIAQSEYERTGGASDKEKNTISLAPAEMAYNDRLAQPGMTYTLNGRSGIQIDMTATSINPLYALDKDGSVIGPTVVTNVLTKANYQAILNMNSAYIGDVKVDSMSLGELAYTGEDVAKVYVPVRNGAPDLGKLEEFKKVHDIFLQNKDKWTPMQAEKFFANNNFPEIKVRKVRMGDGEVDLEIVENNRVKPFLAMPVYTNSASDLSDIPWMLKMTGDLADKADAIMEQAFTVYGGTASKPTSTNLTPDKSLTWEKPYKGLLLIEFRKEAPAILSSIYGHIKGMPATELDVQRNLFYSSNNTGKINASADVFKN